jgi:bifunctional polynucleotide phosphatase/kinase
MQTESQWLRPVNDLFIYLPSDFKSDGHIAAFDLDGTLIRTYKGMFPKDENDLQLLPNRRSVLKTLIDTGFTLVIFTNQKSFNKKSINEKKLNLSFQRVNNFIKMLDLPVMVFMAVGNDDSIYRKPNIGMWTILNQMISVQSSFFVGDAGGQPQDFSDSDLKFAENTGMKFYRPEQIFPSIERLSVGDSKTINTVEFPANPKTMIVFVGMPGSGKTSFYHKNLESLGYVHINQDTLKTRPKVLKLTKESLTKGLPMAIDATNPSFDKRQEFYDLANKSGYSIMTLYFVGDGKGWNKLREKPVPTIAYSMYYKHLVEPTIDNTPGALYQIM